MHLVSIKEVANQVMNKEMLYSKVRNVRPKNRFYLL